MPRLNLKFHRRWAFCYALFFAMLSVVAVRAPSLLPAWPSSSFSADATSVSTTLPQLQVVDFRPRILGYSRDQFGNGWASQVTAKGEYLDTREIVLRRAAAELTQSEPARTKPTLASDEYTGTTETVTAIEIDHIYPLAAAWDMGAWSWEPLQRRQFANDHARNLAATAEALNQEKSDSTPGQWLPPDARGQCHYVSRFLQVAAHYGLAISRADASTAREVCQL